jgi:DnaJ-class molecular chaperone
MRLAGHGLPKMKSSIKGDLYVTIAVESPKKLTAEQKSWWKNYPLQVCNKLNSLTTNPQWVTFSLNWRRGIGVSWLPVKRLF